MKTVPAPLQAHLDTGATTMCYCWRVTRTDGLVQGFTEHDVSLTFLGTTFLASSGFTASEIQQSLGLSVDNLSLDGALSSASLNDDDLAAGRYDNSFVEVFWVNWSDVTQYLLLGTGTIGEVKRTGKAFSAEFRSLAYKLQQKTGRQFQRTCDAVFGDSRCGINKASYTVAGTITAVLGPRTLRVSGLGALASDWFSRGVLTFTSGSNNGVGYDIKDHSVDSSGNVILELWVPPAFPLTVGWTFNALAGCKQTLDVCRDKFSNIANFQGFPHMPGNDVLTKYPTQGGSNQSGGSVVN